MRLLSNEESAKNGEPSLLAIAETTIAVAVSFGIGLMYGSWWHVFIGSCIAPLLLLRTDKSARLGIELYGKSTDALVTSFQASIKWIAKLTAASLWIQLPISFVLLFSIPIFVVSWLLIAVFASKVNATITALVHDVPEPIVAIPRNFWRLTIATDLFVSPVLMPLPDALFPDEENYRNFAAYRFPQMVQHHFFDQQTGKVLRAVNLIKPLIYLGVALAVGVCFAFRFSVKATAIVWFPLLWALKPFRKDGRSWETQLRIHWDQKGPQVVAILSAISLTLFGLKYVLWAVRFKFSELIKTAKHVPGLSEWLHAIIRPEAIPIWHIAVAANSLLGLYFCFRVASWIVEYDHLSGPSETHVNRVVGITFFFRRLLTSYTIIWNVFIVYNVAKLLPVPEIGWQLFPWV